jgi:hypothetical protein
VQPLDNPIGLRALDPGGSALDLLDLQEQLVGVLVGAAAGFTSIVREHLSILVPWHVRAAPAPMTHGDARGKPLSVPVSGRTRSPASVSPGRQASRNDLSAREH